MKLCNFASLDPVQRTRGIQGLKGASEKDKAMRRAFQESWVDPAPESGQLLHG